MGAENNIVTDEDLKVMDDAINARLDAIERERDSWEKGCREYVELDELWNAVNDAYGKVWRTCYDAITAQVRKQSRAAKKKAATTV